MKRFLLVAILLFGLAPAADAQVLPLPPLPEQAAIEQQWLKLRLERVLPQLMRKHNVQMERMLRVAGTLALDSSFPRWRPCPKWGGKELWVGQEEDAVLGQNGRVPWVLKRHTYISSGQVECRI